MAGYVDIACSDWRYFSGGGSDDDDDTPRQTPYWTSNYRIESEVLAAYLEDFNGASSDEDEDEPDHIQFWIPTDGIDVEVLAAYLEHFIDSTPTSRAVRNTQVIEIVCEC